MYVFAFQLKAVNPKFAIQVHQVLKLVNMRIEFCHAQKIYPGNHGCTRNLPQILLFNTCSTPHMLDKPIYKTLLN